MNLTHHGVEPLVTNFTNGTHTKIQWNQIDCQETFIIDFDPAINSESTFTTTNNSTQVFLLYNQTYNIRVIASNCAGNSTPEEISITLGKKLCQVLNHIITLGEHNIVPYCKFSISSGPDDVHESNISEVEVIQTNELYYRCTSDARGSFYPNEFHYSCDIQVIAKTSEVLYRIFSFRYQH